MQALLGGKILELPYYHLMETELDRIPIVVTRTGWSGEVGYEIYLRDGSRGERLWEKIMEAGRPYQIAPIAPSEIRRIEAGILNYGADMTLQENPYEVGLGWLVDLDKDADFIGKGALRRIKAEGVRRKLVGIQIEGERVPGHGHNLERWAVCVDGKRAGDVVDAIYSPRLEKNIGYAMLPIEHAGLGTALSIEMLGQKRSANVVRKPFIDPDKEIPNA